MEEKQKERLILIVVLLVIAIALLMVVAWNEATEQDGRSDHTVSVSVSGQGSAVPSSFTVADGGSVEISIDPSEGWAFSYATVNGSRADAVDGILRIGDVHSDISVRVVFVQSAAAYRLLTVTSTEGGSVSPSGVSAQIPGATVTVVASPSSGRVVSDIAVDGVSRGAINSVDVTMDSDHSIAVTFRAASDSGIVDPTVYIDVDIDVMTTGADWGSIEPCGMVRVAYGGSLVVTVTTNDGYTLESVLVDGSPVDAEPRFTISGITHSIAVGITISGPTVRVFASASYGGSVSPEGPTSVPVGGSLTLAITPLPGYYLSLLTVDGTCSASRFFSFMLSTYTLLDIRSDVTVHAVFTMEPVFPPAPTPPVSGSLDVFLDGLTGTMADDGILRPITPSDYSEGRISQNGVFALDNIVPGVSQTATLRAVNSSTAGLVVALLLKDPAYSESSQGLAEAVRITVSGSGFSVDSSVAELLSSSGWMQYLGVLAPGSSVTLQVTVSLPADTGNEVQGQSLSFDLGVVGYEDH